MEIWKTYLENMEDIILNFQFEPVTAKPTRSYKAQKLRHKKVEQVKVKQYSWNMATVEFTEAVVCRCFSKQTFLKNSQYLQKKTCVEVSF